MVSFHSRKVWKNLATYYPATAVDVTGSSKLITLSVVLHSITVPSVNSATDNFKPEKGPISHFNDLIE